MTTHKHPVKAHTRREKRKMNASTRSNEYGLPRAARRRIKKEHKRGSHGIPGHGALDII